MGQHPIEISVISAISEISASDWDKCADPGENGRAPGDPFTTHRFLQALETSGSVGSGTGWLPRHIIAKDMNKVIAVLPCYAKTHSQGEYIFDHNWAHAYESAGGAYYPKLLAAVPFTPATGRRFLTRPGHEETGSSALIQGAIQLAEQNQVSSFHVTFCTKEEYDAGADLGLLRRTSQQFHWLNNGYKDFDDFLVELSSRKRKAIRRERRQAQEFGGSIHQFTGEEIKPEHWDAFWQFYQDTGARKWGHPYLTRGFFDQAQEHLRNDILLILCQREGRWIAGALNFIGQKSLFGRYWGYSEHHPFLHFELCYYQAIDYAITHGLDRVEAGAQGEHKLARGYLPVPIYSLHWISDAGFRRAVAQYLEAERDAVDQDIEVLTSFGPFRRMTGEEDE